ncbi:MAG: glycosyltransferase family 4 protein [Candidatus Promineifilaceae bacterium]
MPKQKIAIVSQAIDIGGVGALVHFIYDALVVSEQYEPTIISLATSSRDDVSVRLARPDQWHKGVRSKMVPWRDAQVQHIGAHLTELEFMRYRPRKRLTDVLQSFDLVQIVCGSPAVGKAFVELKQPVCLTLATLLEVERQALLADAPLLRKTWSRLMTRTCQSFEQVALRRADHVFAISQYTYELANRTIDAHKLSLTPSGIDTTFFSPAATYAADGPFIAVGRWADPRKNVRMLFKAYHQMREQITVPRLMLVGQTRPTEADWAYAVSLGIADDIDICQNVSRTELAQCYRDASLFLMSSDEEGLGIVVLEAMASGLPVISTRSGGPNLIVQDGINGYLVDVGDAEGLARQTVALMRDPNKRYVMSETAHAFVMQYYASEVIATNYLNVYDKLLSKK